MEERGSDIMTNTEPGYMKKQKLLIIGAIYILVLQLNEMYNLFREDNQTDVLLSGLIYVTTLGLVFYFFNFEPSYSISSFLSQAFIKDGIKYLLIFLFWGLFLSYLRSSLFIDPESFGLAFESSFYGTFTGVLLRGYKKNRQISYLK